MSNMNSIDDRGVCQDSKESGFVVTACHTIGDVGFTIINYMCYLYSQCVVVNPGALIFEVVGRTLRRSSPNLVAGAWLKLRLIFHFSDSDP
jgi:hypothetical protein